MKTKYFSTSWGGLLILAAAAVIIYAATPTPTAASCPGCMGLSVEVVNNPVYRWVPDCSGGYSSQPTNAYPMSSCGGDVRVVAIAQGLDCDGITLYGTFSPVCTGSLTNEIDSVSTNAIPPGTWAITYRVFVKPGQEGKPGTFKVTASVNTQYRDENGICQSINPSVTGSVQYPSGGCSSCNTPGNMGDCDANTGCMDFRLHLGRTQFPEDAGVIWFNAETASVGLSQPLAMQLPFDRNGVKVIRNGATIRQIRVPDGLVNIVTNGLYSYDVQFFYNSDVGVYTNGFYTTNAPAFTTWTVNNPDTNAAYSRLFFTENRGGVIRQFQYSNSVANARWDLTRPDGQIESLWSVADPVNSGVTNEYKQISFGGQILSKTQRTYTNIAAISQRLLTQEILGNDALRTNTYTYYSSGSASNRVQLATYGEGNWTYDDYDAYGRIIKEYSAYNNGAPPSSGEPDPSVNPCKVTQYSYSDHDSSIPLWTTVSIPVYNGSSWDLHEVSATYHDVEAGWDDTQSYVNPETDSSLLETAITQSTVDDYTLGLPLSVQNQDGTTTTYSYPDAWTTIQSLPDGSQTTNIMDDLRNLVSRTTVYGSVVLSSENRIYTNGAGYLDGLRRSYDSTDLANRKTQLRFYDCCGYSIVTNWDGAVTQYDYDSLKRQIASTISYGGPGIKTTNIIDATGRILATQRIGTSGGSPITLQQYQYDSLGNVTKQTNALGGVTTITRALVSNQLYVTNIYPDGGIRLEIYQRDGRLQSVTGTAMQGMQYTYDLEADPLDGNWREVTTETKLDASGSPTSEWVKRFTDGVGRNYLTQYAAATTPYPENRLFYNDQGHLWKRVDPDTNITFYTYYDSGSDINRSSKQYTITALSPTARGITSYDTLVSDLGSGILQSNIDRLTRQYKTVVAATGGKPDLIETDTYAWTNSETDGTGTLISSIAVSTTGLTNWMTQYANASASVTTESRTLYSGTGHSTLSIAPDGSYTTNGYPYGRLASATRYDALNNPLISTSYTYDPHGRQNQITDARNGTTTFAYNNADQVTSMTTPNPGNGGAAEITTTYYNSLLQATNVLQPDGTSVTNFYYVNGLLALTYGSRTYPVGYTYDYAGRMKTMTNWSGFPATGARVTTWNYDSYRGFLASKTYDSGAAGPAYTYTPGGRLATRAWARGTNTTYNYDYAGSLTKISYNDGATSSVTNTYDRLGRMIQAGTANGICQYNYDLANDLLVETNISGILTGLAITNGYDQYLRRTNLSTVASGVLSRTSYSYTNDSRVFTVSDGTNNATYSYVANSPLVSQITFKSNTVVSMTTTKQYDFLNRLTQISNAPSASPAVAFNYTYNSANQRTQDTLADGSYWVYQYDSPGQVTSGKKYWRDGTPVAGQQFEYSFDDIGNRKQTKFGGDDTGANLRVANYTNNTLNQLMGRYVPGYVDIVGIALATNTVTVNGQPAYRKWEYFRKELSNNNSSAAVWVSITNASPGQTSIVGNKYLAKTNEVFSFDADGNLTNDGRWIYTWDGENRLVKMATNTTVGPGYQLTFTYDSKGRRIQKAVLTNNVGIYTNKFLYDGWNLVAVLSPSSQLLFSYTWGKDLSGSQQGAGGVGGLLEVSAGATNSFAGYDGNGNVSILVSISGTNCANYEYGPFGEVIRTTGPMAKVNPFKFSTKYQDEETELLYYGHRYYGITMGRWLSRDPINERGGKNLYGFLNNRVLDYVDALGLCTPGCKMNGKCYIKIVPIAGLTPEQLAATSDLAGAYEAGEFAGILENAGEAAGSGALGELDSSLASGLSAGLEHGATPANGAESAVDVINRPNSQGSSAYILMRWQTCRSRFCLSPMRLFGSSTYLEDESDPEWRSVSNGPFEGDYPGENRYAATRGPSSSGEAGRRACAKAMEEFEKENSSCK